MSALTPDPIVCELRVESAKKPDGYDWQRTAQPNEYSTTDVRQPYQNVAAIARELNNNARENGDLKTLYYPEPARLLAA